MQDFFQTYTELLGTIEKGLAEIMTPAMPESIREPGRYVLEGGGKRIRPVLVLLASEAAGAKAEDALHAGIAVEILHNFTLVHDDIMDNALQRRGRPTVHSHWDNSIAILVGDELIGLAYRELLRTEKGNIRALASTFTEGMIEVCEGQALDKEFEARVDVSPESYFKMIGKKTGRLVAMAMELGSIVADADVSTRSCLMEYGTHIGRAFQVQDDLLDVFAETSEFGKVIGGDILEGKKTFLLVHALESATGEDRIVLNNVASRSNGMHDVVQRVTEIYKRLGIVEQARACIRSDTDAALNALRQIPSTQARSVLEWLAEQLLQRSH